jgi:hypothetical protein
VGRGHLGAGLPEHVEGELQELRPGVLEHHVAARHGHRHGIGPGLDAVRQHLVGRTAQAGHALDHDLGRAGALDPGAHLDEARREVRDLRLAGRVADDRGAVGQGRGHHGHMGAADRDLGEIDLGALQALRGGRHDVAGIDLDGGPELGQGHDQEVYRTGADGAAAGHGHLGVAEPGEKRGDDPEARPHGRDEFVRRAGVDDRPGGQADGLAGFGRLARAPARNGVVDPEIGHDPQQGCDVGEPRHVAELQRLLGEQAGDHQRQGRVLGA